jgi:hypothetical protein
MTSIFLELEGDNVKNRIWDFLVVFSEFDYSMKEIADNSDISYSALKLIWKDFVKRDIVVHTRDVGNSKMYKLNRDNPQVEKFIDYYWSVVESGIDKPKVEIPA